MRCGFWNEETKPVRVCQSSSTSLGGLGKVVGEVDFGFAQLAQLVDGELKAVLVLVDEAFDLKEIVLLEGVEDFFDVIPHFGFELAAAVAESEREVGLAGFLGLDLLADDDESSK